MERIRKTFTICLVCIAIIGCKNNTKTTNGNANFTYSPLTETTFIDNLAPYIDSTTYIIPEILIPSPICKTLIDNNKNIYLLGFRGDLATLTPEGKRFRHFTNKGRARNEYHKINDIALRSYPHELLILDETKVLCFSIDDTSSFKTINIPHGIPFDAIAPSGERNYWLFSAFPKDSKNLTENKDYLLKLIDDKGNILKEKLKREDWTFSIMNITQSANNTYCLRPQNTNHIFYQLGQDTIYPHYKIDFGNQNIPARYYFTTADNNITNYMQAPYFKQPSFAHETEKHFYFKCAGPNAIEYNFLMDKKHPDKSIGWINRDQTSDLYIIGADNIFFYIIFNKYQAEQYLENPEKRTNPLYSYIMQTLDCNAAFKNSDEIIIKLAFQTSL